MPWKRILTAAVAPVWLSLLLQPGLGARGPAPVETVSIDKSGLLDKIKGGWAGQVIGCTFGGPTEFRFQSTFIPDSMPIEWDENRMAWYFEQAPGLYDDIYMDLTFVQVFADHGLDAPAEVFARAFAEAEYPLWHANVAARYNILRGILPPESGHWLNNPHSDDIDFQIEADFAGLMCPGMINSAAAVCDRIGHIMNFGDGWYGGVFVAAMYSQAFLSDDPGTVVTRALDVIPEQSAFHRCMTDILRWHREDPADWKATWFKAQRKWGEDIGCPVGVFAPFNIDAKINSAWILLGLLYGEGDFGKTLSISTRAGDDSDCNPASAGGILGTILGYDRIPAYWKQGLDRIEGRDFAYTSLSLEETYRLSYEQALQQIRRNGGREEGDAVTIAVQAPEPVPLEIGFEGHFPVARKNLGIVFSDSAAFEFEGIGFSITGGARKTGSQDRILQVEMFVDGISVEKTRLPTASLRRKDPPFWKFRLERGRHEVRLRVIEPVEGAEIVLNDLIVYDDRPSVSRH